MTQMSQDKPPAPYPTNAVCCCAEPIKGVVAKTDFDHVHNDGSISCTEYCFRSDKGTTRTSFARCTFALQQGWGSEFDGQNVCVESHRLQFYTVWSAFPTNPMLLCRPTASEWWLICSRAVVSLFATRLQGPRRRTPIDRGILPCCCQFSAFLGRMYVVVALEQAGAVIVCILFTSPLHVVCMPNAWAVHHILSQQEIPGLAIAHIMCMHLVDCHGALLLLNPVELMETICSWWCCLIATVVCPRHKQVAWVTWPMCISQPTSPFPLF